MEHPAGSNAAVTTTESVAQCTEELVCDRRWRDVVMPPICDLADGVAGMLRQRDAPAPAVSAAVEVMQSHYRDADGHGDANEYWGVGRYWDATVKVGVYDAPVVIRLVRIDESAITMDEGMRVCMAGASIACISIDVVRGRLSPAGLYRFMTSVSVSRLLLFGELSHNDPNADKPWLGLPAAIRLKSIVGSKSPVVPLRVRAMTFGADRADMVVSLMVGETNCWASMRWVRRGGRWICDLCDIG